MQTLNCRGAKLESLFADRNLFIKPELRNVIVSF